MAVKSHHPDQLEIFAVPSPCVGVCQSGPKGYCVGCYRTRDERLYWLKVDDAAKRTIIRSCQRRKLMANRPSDDGDKTAASGEPQQHSLFSDGEQ